MDAIPPIIPAPTKAGINGTKILAIERVIRLKALSFPFLYFSLFSFVICSVLARPDVNSGSRFSSTAAPLTLPDILANSVATLLAVPGPTTTCKLFPS